MTFRDQDGLYIDRYGLFVERNGYAALAFSTSCIYFNMYLLQPIWLASSFSFENYIFVD